MAIQVNRQLLNEIKRVGAFDISACFNCGNCTAICPLSKEGEEFPRKMIRYAAVGLEEKLLSSPELWSCYYCGECTQTCPRDADPGAFMMAARRYAIRKYGWGKISDAMYSSKTAFYGVLSALSLILAAILITVHGPMTLPHIEMFTFIPMQPVDRTGMVMGVFIGVSVIANLLIMSRYLSRDKKIHLGLDWLKRLPGNLAVLVNVIVQEVAIQKRFQSCTTSKNRYWAHLLLVWGFFGLLAATTLDYAIDSYGLALSYYVPRGVGIASGLALVYGAGYFLYKRFERKDEYAIYSHFSDWAFLVLLLLVGASGFLLDLFIFAEMALAAYVTYAVHLVIVFDLLVTAPFTKFVHALYRPFALLMEEQTQAAVQSELLQQPIPIAA